MPLGPALGQCCGGSVTLAVRNPDFHERYTIALAAPLVLLAAGGLVLVGAGGAVVAWQAWNRPEPTGPDPAGLPVGGPAGRLSPGSP